MKLLVFLIRGYQIILSPAKTALFGPAGHCRFTPTCSQYAVDAVKTHGAGRGVFLGIRRIMRCHPWGGSGYDPVPPAVLKRTPCGCSRHHRPDRFTSIAPQNLQRHSACQPGK
ncbi:MAG: membrane protein insertion efficiency factor YidD [Verrucomicrobia bacterium]|nr:membrane protein insertion efficiency factor YidD [Verrucomicrobiota bacterium]MCF7707855.1 membrane protein insertion efficiency factor YidD [Verrucomicrobiota bacterium]